MEKAGRVFGAIGIVVGLAYVAEGSYESWRGISGGFAQELMEDNPKITVFEASKETAKHMVDSNRNVAAGLGSVGLGIWVYSTGKRLRKYREQ